MAFPPVCLFEINFYTCSLPSVCDTLCAFSSDLLNSSTLELDLSLLNDISLLPCFLDRQADNNYRPKRTDVKHGQAK